MEDRLIVTRDVIFTLLLPLLTAVAWLAPRRRWDIAAGIGSRIAEGALVGPTTRRKKILKNRFGIDEQRSSALYRGLAGEQLIRLLEVLRQNRPGAAPPRIEVDGADGPRTDVASGRGAIIWWSPCVHRDLVAKIGLAQAGLSIFHLSRLGHGISPTRYGRNVLNRLIMRLEMRYVKGRAEINPDAPAGATLKLRRELKQGGAVGVAAAVSKHRGSSEPIVAPFMGGRFRFAPGAATLAAKTGAGLYPVVIFRSGGEYRVTIGPDLSDPDGDVEGMIRRFAEWNEAPVTGAMHQWSGWQQV